MKIILSTKFFLVTLLIFCSSFQLKSQCLTGATIGTLTPLITWQTVAVAAGVPAYRSFNAISGVTYTFTFCQGGGSYSGDPYLTVSNNVPASQAFNDDFCSLGSEIIWTCGATGIYRLYLSGCCPCSNAPSSTLAYRGSSNPFPPAPNDNCVGAINITVPGTAVGTTTNASIEAGAIGVCLGTPLTEAGVWYSVVGNGNKIGVDLCNTAGWNSKVFIYSGNCGSLTCVTSNDDNGPMCLGTAGSATFCSVPTMTYYILVTGFNSASAFSIAVTETVVGAAPSVTVSATTPSFCTGFPASFNASGAQIYLWNTGDVTPSMTITPTAITVYTVTGWSAATCGSETQTVTFAYHPNPTVTATVSQPSVCSGNTVAFVGGGANTYTWTGGVTNGVPYFPSFTSNYTCTGSSALGCTASAVAALTVVATPVLAPVSNPSLICIGSSATISVSGATNYTWTPGNLNTGTIVVNPTSTTTYTLVKANSNCVDTKTITLYVNNLPTVVAIAQPTLICAGTSATLSGGGANTYTWIPSAFNLIGTNVIVSPMSTTIYTMTGSDGTCVATTTVQLNTKTTPTITAATSATAICVGQSVTLTASGAGTGGTYLWTPGGAGAVIVDAPLIPSSYLVVGTNSLGCSAQISAVVIVYTLPLVNAVANRTLVCVAGPSTLTATGANTYFWIHNSATTNTTLVNPIVTSIYTVVGTNTVTTCSNTKTVMVQAYTPVTAINGPTAVCIGSSITISSAPANSYSWSLNGTPLGNSQNLLVGPLVNTTYSLGTTSTSNNVSCVGANTVTIIVNPLPIVTASTTRSVICRDYESTTLTGGGAVTYNWLFQGASTSIVVSPQSQSTYTVEGTDANGCVNTATILVKVSACIGINEKTGDQVMVNIFPNPSAGEFVIKSSQSMDLNLVNELGQVVRKLSLNSANNYEVNVKEIATGVYFVVSQNKGLKVNQKLIIQK